MAGASIVWCFVLVIDSSLQSWIYCNLGFIWTQSQLALHLVVQKIAFVGSPNECTVPKKPFWFAATDDRNATLFVSKELNTASTADHYRKLKLLDATIVATTMLWATGVLLATVNKLEVDACVK